VSRHPGGAETEAAGDRARGFAGHSLRRGRPRPAARRARTWPDAFHGV